MDQRKEMIEFIKSFFPQKKYIVIHKDVGSKITFYLPMFTNPEKWLRECGYDLSEYELTK